MTTENYIVLTVLFAAITAIATLINVLYIKSQIKKDHEWRRRKSTQDLMFEFESGAFSETKRTLVIDYGAQFGSLTQTVNTISEKLEENKKTLFYFNVARLLNLYESFALGIKNKTLDEDICFDSKRKIVKNGYRWLKPRIDFKQEANPRAWIEFERLSEKWEKRYKQNIKDSDVKPKDTI